MTFKSTAAAAPKENQKKNHNGNVSAADAVAERIMQSTAYKEYAKQIKLCT